MNWFEEYNITFHIDHRQHAAIQKTMPNVFKDVRLSGTNRIRAVLLCTYAGSADAILRLVALIEVNRKNPYPDSVVDSILGDG